MEEKELFEHYEHRVWEITPTFKKTIGASVLINLLGLLIIAQFNIFTTRGCDTPYVGAVCQVLDSAYVASVFFGKGAEWESRPYTPTEIGEDEVTIINVGDRLEYPEGYFYKDQEVLPPSSFENLTSSNSGDPLAPAPSQKSPEDMIAVVPTPNPKNEKQSIPDSPFDFGGKKDFVYKNPQKTNPPRSQGKNEGITSNKSPNKLPGEDKVAVKPTPKPTPSATATPTADELKSAKDGFKLNKAPLQTFADGVIAKIDSKVPQEKVDLKKNFKVVLDGTLTEEGTFDPKKTSFSTEQLQGDPQMVKVAEDAIKALGDSMLFSYLKTLGVDKINITLVQDDKNISAVIKSNLPSPEKARTISSGFNGLIVLANINTKDDAEVQSLLKNVKFKPDGKSFVINFEMAKDEAHQLIDKKLEEARQKKSQTNNVEAEKNAASKGR
jgi:hypothetical protein